MGETEWGDPNVSDGFESSGERYKARGGMKDLVRIISKPIRYYSHQLSFAPFYISCNKENGRCPACEQKITRKQRVGCLLIHIAEKEQGSVGDWKPVGTVKPWLFSKDRWFDICEIMDNYPQLRSDLTKHDLIFSCKDPKFQKIVISPTLQDTQATKAMAANLDEAQEYLNFMTAPMDADTQLEKLGDYTPGDEGVTSRSDRAENKPKTAAETLSDNQIGELMDSDDPGAVPF